MEVSQSMTQTIPRGSGMAGGPVDMENDLDPPFTPERQRASWGARVIAVLLDSAIVSSVAFLATGASVPLAAIPSLDVTLFVDGELRPSLDTSGGTSGGAQAWTGGTLLVLGLFQAYTGRSVGKRVCGIAVVDDRTGRPVGLLRTVLRFVAHVLDSILLVGYVRAAFNAEGRTFADSLLSTVAVRTTAPVPHPWVARLATARDDLAPSLRWPTAVTGGVALVVCAGAAAMSLVQGAAEDERHHAVPCPVDVHVDGPGDVVEINAVETRTIESRLGIDRVTDTSWHLEGRWEPALDRALPAGSTTEIDVRSPTGTYASASATADGAGGYSETYSAVIGGETDDDYVGVDLWIESNEPLAGWIVTSQVTAPDGVVQATCTGRVPGASER